MCLLKGSFVIRVSLTLSGSEDFSRKDIKQVIFFSLLLHYHLYLSRGGSRPYGGARSTTPTTHMMPSAQLSMVTLTTANLYGFEILYLFFVM